MPGRMRHKSDIQSENKMYHITLNYNVILRFQHYELDKHIGIRQSEQF